MRSICKPTHNCAMQHERKLYFGMGWTYYQLYEHSGTPCSDGIFQPGNLDKAGDFQLAKRKSLIELVV